MSGTELLRDLAEAMTNGSYVTAQDIAQPLMVSADPVDQSHAYGALARIALTNDNASWGLEYSLRALAAAEVAACEGPEHWPLVVSAWCGVINAYLYVGSIREGREALGQAKTAVDKCLVLHNELLATVKLHEGRLALAEARDDRQCERDESAQAGFMSAANLFAEAMAFARDSRDPYLWIVVLCHYAVGCYMQADYASARQAAAMLQGAIGARTLNVYVLGVYRPLAGALESDPAEETAPSLVPSPSSQLLDKVLATF